MLIMAAMIAAGLPLYAADEAPVDENALFGNAETVVDSSTYEKKADDQNEKHVGISGELTSVNTYSASREFFEKDGTESNMFSPYIDGTLLLDIRLPQNVKGLGSFEALYNAQNEESEYHMRELFLDFNLRKKVFFRTGKQVLQWGRCYLWNPTDLVNVEKKSFTAKIGSREGAYGIKAHVPFGTAVNLYGFVNTAGVSEIEKCAGSAKAEFLIGKTEMAFSVWGKKGYHPVAGYDFSTKLFGIDILGEASVSRGSNEPRVYTRYGTVYVPATVVIAGNVVQTQVPLSGSVLSSRRDNEKIVPKASIDFGRAFDVGDQTDKIQINIEGYYNGAGYARNILSDTKRYYYDADLELEMNGQKVTIPSYAGGTKAVYLYGNNLYNANSYSKYYAALFTTVNEFLISELTLNLNCIGNILHRSVIGSAGISYADINDLKLSVLVNGYFGPRSTEYTYRNGVQANGADIRLTAGIIF